jgi:hypothetical protein
LTCASPRVADYRAGAGATGRASARLSRALADSALSKPNALAQCGLNASWPAVTTLPKFTIATFSFGVLLLSACAADTGADESVDVSADELISCGFIRCPSGMRCEKNGRTIADPKPDAVGTERGVCVAEPCSRKRCLSNQRCVEKVSGTLTTAVCEQDRCSAIRCPASTRCVEVQSAGGIVPQCQFAPCSTIRCMQGTRCVERQGAGGMVAACELDRCVAIRCVGNMHCEEQETPAGRMGICVR